MHRLTRLCLNRVVSINAGGRLFQTYRSTVCKYPDSSLASLFPADTDAGAESAQAEVFVDVSPDVFERVLAFLRTGRLTLPVRDDGLRAEVVGQLHRWGLLEHAFPPEDGSGEGAENISLARLPDVCVVQLCDHMQHDQGVKRHAMTITYGADGFGLRGLTQRIRQDLHGQLSSTFWQCYQTGERAAFFTTTKVANGAADLLTTAITQQVVSHTESYGYHLASSYVTLSPDVVHTSVRMLIHHFIFRRVRLPALEETDAAALEGAEEQVEEEETFRNITQRDVGPQRTVRASRPAPDAAASAIWPEE